MKTLRKKEQKIDISEISEISRIENTIFNEINIVKEVLNSMFILNVDSKVIRNYVRRDNSQLNYDASNLSSVLDRLSLDVRRYKRYTNDDSIPTGISNRTIENLKERKKVWDRLLDTIGIIPEYKDNRYIYYSYSSAISRCNFLLVLSKLKIR